MKRILFILMVAALVIAGCCRKSEPTKQEVIKEPVLGVDTYGVNYDTLINDISAEELIKAYDKAIEAYLIDPTPYGAQLLNRYEERLNEYKPDTGAVK